MKRVVHDNQAMTQSRAQKSLTLVDQPQPPASFPTRLTGEELDALRRCAKGISLRFDAWEIVNALVDGGYADKGVAGVITMTALGEAYLRAHAT